MSKLGYTGSKETFSKQTNKDRSCEVGAFSERAFMYLFQATNQ